MDYQFASIGPALRILVLIFLFLFVIALVATVAGIASLPGWIARRRNHPQAAAVNICGWFGLPTGVLWVLAMVWAYYKAPKQPVLLASDSVDLRERVDRLDGAIAQLEAIQK
jgi:uncharacterized BrkB/YihY/UPF0761 family membrane protein